MNGRDPLRTSSSSSTTEVRTPPAGATNNGGRNSSARNSSASTATSKSGYSRLNNDDTATKAKEALEAQQREQKEKARLRQNALPPHIRMARIIVENTYFTILTTVLTIYALTGDDIRLIFTNKPADIIFDVLVSTCFLVFTVEVFVSCLGKPDYWLGFFFTLDVISTATLLLDLTPVNNWIFHSNPGTVEGMKNSRTAKIGARASRIVRILRLVRILKLYKAVYEARQRAAQRKKDKEENPDDWEADDGQDPEAGLNTAESNLGKKLSDLTTRRCVILILGMMLGHPMLQADENDTMPGGEAYAANMVQTTFASSLSNSSTRWQYEEEFLTYVYYHNWFQGNGDPKGERCPSMMCPTIYDQHLFYVGIASGDPSALSVLGSDARITQAGMDRFQAELQRQQPTVDRMRYSYGEMPVEAEQALMGSWTSCESKLPGVEKRLEIRVQAGEERLGISLLDESPEWLEEYGRPFTVTCPEDLRPAEITQFSALLVTPDQYETWRFVFYFDKRLITRHEAIINFLTTAFICVVLCGASMVFAHDAQELVLKPIESMMMKVNMIRRNPLIASKLTDEAYKQEQVKLTMEKNAQKKKSKFGIAAKKILGIVCCTKADDQKKVPNETAILEQTIMKLGTLLALGLGEAGMGIIAENMKGGDSAGVDAMITGRIVDCIIGSTRMGEFSTFTEVLQGRVMTFVNQVAEVLHGLVDAYHGAPSRNNGDTFLAVWTLDGFDSTLVGKMADMATLAFALVLAAIHRSPVLAAYRTHPGLQQRMGRKLRVTTSFGLHLGWAIEGALGSEYKIDATYVSPNVSIAESAEEATAAYGSNILLTEDIYSVLSTHSASVARLIDKVTIRGSKKPLRLYSLDLDCTTLSIDYPKEQVRWNIRQRFRVRQFLEKEKTNKLEDDNHVASVWENHPDIQAMLAPYTTAFREIFGMGYQNYSQGEWKTAQRLLSRTLTQLGFEDGPSAALLRFMQSPSYNMEAPVGWAGVHALDSMPPRHTHRLMS